MARDIKQNLNIFASFICKIFNSMINLSTFLADFSWLIWYLFSKKVHKIQKKIIDLYGFCQDNSAQHCLLAMIEKWKRCVDLLTDLSKAFDFLPHDFIVAKFIAYGFSLLASKLVPNFLSHRKQRTKINSSSWEEVFGVPPRSWFTFI